MLLQLWGRCETRAIPECHCSGGTRLPQIKDQSPSRRIRWFDQSIAPKSIYPFSAASCGGVASCPNETLGSAKQEKSISNKNRINLVPNACICANFECIIQNIASKTPNILATILISIPAIITGYTIYGDFSRAVDKQAGIMRHLQQEPRKRYES